MNLFKLTWSKSIFYALIVIAFFLSGDGQSLLKRKLKSSNKMVAIVAHLARIYENLFVRHHSSTSVFYNPKIPAPPILHKVLDDSFLSKFDHILIVGDLHGCYDEMIDLLNLASKTTSKSRILKLFVGDLVNKGPKSKEIIDYFMNNGREDMLAVRGNHDELIIKLYMQYLKDKKLELNVETEWIKNLDSEHIDFLISLPYTISLPKLNSIIVHAGLIPGKQIEQNNWLDMTKMRNVVIEDYYDGAGVKGVDKPTTGDPWINTWKRDDLHVFFGHDALRGLQLSEYATGLDTGAVYGNKLSAVLINQNNLKKQFIEVKSKRKYCDPFKREPRIRNPSN